MRTSRRLARPSASRRSQPDEVPQLTHPLRALSRVYFSTPPNTKPGDDYLVDHSIFFYLMDPTGKFVDAFGRSMGAQDVADKVRGYLDEWKEHGGKGSWSDTPTS